MPRHAAFTALMGAFLQLSGPSIIGQANGSRTPEPLLIDLKGNGYALTSAADGVFFDLNGLRTPQQIGWTSPGSDDAFLVIDENHNGRIDDGHEVIGGISGPANGFAMLAAFDGFETDADFRKATNRHPDGMLTPTDAIFHHLLLWTDANHNGLSEEDELESVAHAGVVNIYLGYKGITTSDPYGNLLRYQGTVTLRNEAGVDVLRQLTSIRFEGVSR
jgi:hypothetical protein